jgi:multidrug efflux system outer membrane protein
MKNLHRIIPTIICFLTLSCTMVPKYKTPESDISLAEHQEKNSKIAWQTFFESDDLKRIIKIALKNNDDLKIANLNIESARQIHGIARSRLLPTIAAGASETRQGVSGPFASFTPKRIYRANVNFTSFELDFFGRLKSLKKSAQEDFLSTIEARNLVRITLIAETANSYAQLILDQEILKIKKDNFAAMKKKSKIMKDRVTQGLNSRIDDLNIISALEKSKIEIATYEKLVTQDRNALMTLIGDFNEDNLPKISKISKIKIAENALKFIPSRDLLSRPDIKRAEHKLKSVNANIGAARAALFPSISLTGSYGYQSLEATDLFNSKNWTFTPSINVPIFSGGRATANLENSKILKKIEIVEYQDAIENAFRETLDKLADRKALLSQLESSSIIFDAKEHSYQISNNQLKFGLINRLEHLDYYLEFLQAKESDLTLRKEYLINLIELYKTLGGGSEVEELNKLK